MLKLIGFIFLIFTNVFAKYNTKVVLVHSENVWKEDKINQPILDSMLQEGMLALLDTNTPKTAWKQVFEDCTNIAIKVNTLAETPLISTRAELAMAVAKSIHKYNKIKKDKITIFDRGLKCTGTSNKCKIRKSMAAAGYKLNRKQNSYQIIEAREKGNWQEYLSIKNRFFTVIEKANCLVNMPVLKDHHIMGVTFALKNHIGSVSNPQLFHKNNGIPGIADLNKHPYIKNNSRLIVGDMLRCQYKNGPHSDINYQWNANTIILGTDPVAVDTIAFNILKTKWREMNFFPSHNPSENQPGAYILYAAKTLPGEANLNNIDIVNINIEE